MLNINRLRILREFAVRKTIAATAEALFMTSSAVSQQLATLERETGLELLQRDGRTVAPTETARKLIYRSEEIFQALEHTEAEIAMMNANVGSTIRISAFPTAARRIIVPLLQRFKDTAPNLLFHVSDLEPEEALPMLRAEDLDIMVYYDWTLLPSLPSIGVVTTQLLDEHVYLAMNKQHPLANEHRPISLIELENETWISGRESTSMGALIQAATGREGYGVESNFQTMDFSVILTAVGAGLGLSLVPPLGFSTRSRENVCFKRIKGLELKRTIKAAVRKGSENNTFTEMVLTELKQISDEVARDLERIDAEIC